MKRILFFLLIIAGAAAICLAEDKKTIYVFPVYSSGDVSKEDLEFFESQFRQEVSKIEKFRLADKKETAKLRSRLKMEDLSYNSLIGFFSAKASVDEESKKSLAAFCELSGKNNKKSASFTVTIYDPFEKQFVYNSTLTYNCNTPFDIASAVKNCIPGHIENIAKIDTVIKERDIKQSADANITYVLSLTAKYMPAGYFRYIEKHSLENKTIVADMGKKDAVFSLPTIFHEITHGYTGINSYSSSGNYRVTPDREFLLSYYPGFPSREIDALAPPEVQKLFRYQPYIIKSDDNQGTQIHGFFGLLDEYNAYHWSARISMMIYPVLKGEFGTSSPDLYIQYLGSIASERYSVDTFKIFIAQYLKKAQKDDPELYTKIISDEKAKELFTFIEKEDAQTQKEYDRIRREIITMFGAGVQVSDGNIMTVKESTAVFARSMQDKEFANVQRILRKEDCSILDNLRK